MNRKQNRYSPEQRSSWIAEFQARRAQDPGASLITFAKEKGISKDSFYSWVRRAGIDLSETRGAAMSAGMLRATLERRGENPHIGAWLAKHGDRMKADLGTEKTLVSSSALFPPESPRQPELPFRAEPVRAEPVRKEDFAQPVASLLGEAARQALQERDALKIVLQMFIRENGGKLPGQ